MIPTNPNTPCSEDTRSGSSGPFVQQTPPRPFWQRIIDQLVPARSQEPTPLRLREQMRQARLNAVLILIMLVLCVVSLPAGWFGTNWLLIPLLVGLFCMTLGTIPFNRQGWTNTSGTIVVLASTAAVAMNIFTTPGGLSFQALPIFTLFLMPMLLAGAMLSVWLVILDAALNIGLCFLLVAITPHAPDVAAHLDVAYTNTALLQMVLQVLVAGVILLIRQSLVVAYGKRDRAEEVIRLHQDLRVNDALRVQQAHQLEAGITVMQQIHARVSNGDLDARVILPPDHLLAPLAASLNLILNRLQRASLGHQDGQRLEQAVVHAREVLRWRQEPTLTVIPASGTAIDALLQEAGVTIVSPAPPQSRQDTVLSPHQKPGGTP